MLSLYTDKQIDDMKPAGRFSCELLDLIEPYIKPGISTLEINEIIHEHTSKHGYTSAPLNYHGFPKSVCTSVNDVVCHGIPNAKQKLKEGDIINVDVTPIVDGYHGDSSRTFFVGKPSAKIEKLVRVTRECLERGMATVKIGSRVGDIGAAIQQHAEINGFSVVRDFVGHGIGRQFHEEPQIPHYGKAGTGTRFQAGMVFTIEPMINTGHWKTKVRKDGWTAVTLDGGWSAQFEHTMAIRSDGSIDVLTRKD